MKHTILTITLLLLSALSATAQTADELFQQGQAAENANNFALATEIYMRAKDAFAKESRGETAEAAQCLHNLARAFANQNKLEESRKYNLEAMALRKRLFGEVSEPYITTHNNYALTFSIEKNYTKAIELQTKTITLMEQLPKQHTQAGLFYYNQGRYYYLVEDYANAAVWWEKGLPAAEKFSELYERCLEGLGLVYQELNQQDNLHRIMGLMDEHNQHELTKPCDEPDCMLERARYYASTGDNAKARECYNKVREMPMTNEQKVKVYEAYAQFLAANKDYATGAENYLVAAKAQEAMDGQSEAYAMLMYKAAQFSFIGKQYEQAIDCYNTVIAFYGQKSSDAALKNIILCKEGMSNAYSGMKDFEAAIPLRREVLEYYTTTKPDKAKQAKAVVSLANAEKFSSHYDEAIGHYKQGLALYDELGKAEEYTNTASSLNMCYIYAGREERADYKDEEKQKAQNERLHKLIKEEKEGLQLTKDYLGMLTYAHSLAVIAGSYVMLEDYANGAEYYKQYIEAIRTAIRNEFRLRSERDRMLLWEEEKSRMNELMELLVLLPAGNESLMPDLTAIAYDVQLLSKGILLNSSIEFEQVLQNTDSRLLSIYEETKQNDKQLMTLRQTAATDADMEKIQKLMRKNETLQLELYRGCAEYADFTNYISYAWQDVQRALPDDGVAIEFAAIKTGVLDQDNYMAALVITKDSKTPTVLPICNLQVAKAMEQDSLLFDTPLAGNMVWGGLLKQYIEGKHKIYFSADGSFNRIGIEYLQWEGRPLFDQFEVYRLSSTKELCYQRKAITTTDVALIGNIAYNEYGELTTNAQRNIRKVRGIGGEFDNLDETRREIAEISAILKKAKVKHIATLQEAEASEQAFRQFSGSKVNILHIATHGAYKEQKKETDAESMQNSLLAFAGANLRDDDSEESSDGIVTAADVSQMNLRQCDIVVLSACETGLGKLSDDGVFGLQRGFKNAGVHTLLMSLKNVYDDATADMMIAFYRHLSAGKTKLEALRQAQAELRRKGFTSANQWTPFILLDANELKPRL